MNAGRSLVALAQELTRQNEARKDYLAPAGAIDVAMHGTELHFGGFNGSAYPLTKHAQDQVREFTKIPAAYFDLMKAEAPDLLGVNVRAWFEKKATTRRQVRTLDGRIRAFVSPSYRALDNFDLAEVVLPELQQRGCEITSSDLTEKRMYIKALYPDLSLEVKGSRQKGDIVQAGVVISNSEVGAGALKVEPLIYRLVCLNGMIAPDAALRRYHVGKAIEGDGVFEVLSDEAKRADDQAVWLKVRDVVRAAFDRDLFVGMVNRMSEAAAERLDTRDLPKVVEVTRTRLGLPERVQGSILQNLIEGGDLSRWGLVNAVTKVANTEADYETATELERAGGKILELPARDWRVIREAA